jgi:LPS sulfotransferase NodH
MGISTDLIYIVSGLPRSGTSLMMQILEAAGIKNHTDNIRVPDESNPKGYAEFEAVKSLMKSNAFMKEAKGKSLKIVTPLIPFIDSTLKYKAIVMNRAIDEVLDSQQVMLGKEKGAASPVLKTAFEKQLATSKAFFEKHEIPYLEIEHKNLIQNSENELSKVINFLELDNSVEQLINCIDPNLYRQRK